MDFAFQTGVTDATGNEFAVVWVVSLCENGTHSRPITLSVNGWLTMLTIDEAVATARLLMDGARATDQTMCEIGGWFRPCSRVEASGLGLALMNASTVANRILGARAAA
jgi:hypothetical protein